MKRNHKDYFIYYLKENVLIFDIFDYIEELGSETVDFFYDWNLVKDEKVVYKQKTVKEFLKNKISRDIEKLNQFVLKNFCTTFCFFSERNDLNLWSMYFEDPNKFIKHCKRICKTQLPNFIENKNLDVVYFQKVKGHFNSIPCLLPSGEDELFLQKNIKKSKIPIDI